MKKRKFKMIKYCISKGVIEKVVGKFPTTQDKLQIESCFKKKFSFEEAKLKKIS